MSKTTHVTANPQAALELVNGYSLEMTGKDVPGFLNRYAAGGVEEDKAEVFAHLMVEPKEMKDRAGKDKYMRAKIDRMKELLREFSPRADEDFWKKVEKAVRPEVE